MKNIFLFAGEMSGDLHGSRLAKALKKFHPTIALFGIGGPLMRQEGINGSFQMEDFQVMGFSAILTRLPILYSRFNQIKRDLLRKNPDAIVLIDSPFFSLHLAKSLRKGGYRGKIVQYICPSIWAYGKHRISTLTSYFDLLLTIYPFEASYFPSGNLRIKYVGNPLAQTIQTHTYRNHWKQELGILPEKQIIALFPGSRKHEIVRHAPLQLRAAAYLQQKYPEIQFCLSCAQTEFEPILKKWMKQIPVKNLFLIPPYYQYELMRASSAALAKSGTVTLELALHQVPTIVHYEFSYLNYIVAKYFFRLSLPHYCIVNILANKEIFPEVIEKKQTAAVFHNTFDSIVSDSQRKMDMQEECKKIAKLLGNDSSDEQAAQAILEIE